MKEDYILGGLLLIGIGAFYYFATQKPSLSVQLMDSQGNLATKGSPQNPVTTADIQAVSDLLKNLLTLKAQQV
jgi:hypothetical protein